MGIENNTHEIEVQNQELQRANREQIEQANKEHEELGKVLDGLDTLDNEAELDEISGNEDISEQDDTASQLDNNDKIEDEPSEQLETINNPAYNEVENNGFSINDVNQAVDAKEAYEAEIRDMSQDEYHDQKELDQRVEENDSEPNMTEPSVLGNDLHQGDVSNKETDNLSRLNEVEQNPGVERSVQETPEDLQGFNMEKGIQPISRENPMPDSIDRYGKSTGTFVAGMKEGESAPYDTRALPNMENPEAYHKYNVDSNHYFEAIDIVADTKPETIDQSVDKMNNMIDAINKENGTDIEHIASDDMKDMLADYTDYKNDLEKNFPEMSIEDAKYGLSGEAAAWINDRDEKLSNGGAEQEWLPMSVSDFNIIGVMEEK